MYLSSCFNNEIALLKIDSLQNWQQCMLTFIIKFLRYQEVNYVIPVNHIWCSVIWCSDGVGLLLARGVMIMYFIPYKSG